jgi:hypothetical protein
MAEPAFINDDPHEVEGARTDVLRKLDHFRTSAHLRGPQDRHIEPTIALGQLNRKNA